MHVTLAFVLQFVSSIVFFWFLAAEYVMPRMSVRPLRALLMPLVSVHVLRTVGLIYMATGPLVIDGQLPESFLRLTAWGDLAAAALAIVAVHAMRKRMRAELALVWLFNVVGCADLLVAMANGARIDFLSYQVGIAWFLPAFIVPMLLASHVLMFYLLLRHPEVRVRAARALLSHDLRS